MKVELSQESQSKIEDLLEQMYLRYDLEDLTPETLIDALLDLGVDIVLVEDASLPRVREKLLDYCARKMHAEF